MTQSSSDHRRRGRGEERSSSPLACLSIVRFYLQLDMRKRFRGNPSTTNNKKEGPAVSVIGFGLQGAGDPRKQKDATPPTTTSS